MTDDRLFSPEAMARLVVYDDQRRRRRGFHAQVRAEAHARMLRRRVALAALFVAAVAILGALL